LNESHDAAIRVLTDYHDRLDRAATEGAKSLDEAFKNSPTGIGAHEIDTKMCVVRVNPEELRILGYREEEMVGRPIFEKIVMQDASRRAIEQKLSGEKKLKPFVRSFRRSDGTAMALMLMDRLLRDEQGRIVGIRTAMTEVRG
jgi:PAS domain S-box-containing protein